MQHGEDNKKRSNPDNVVQLPDAEVGETETDDPLRPRVIFELPANRSSSPQPAVAHSDYQEAKALINELIESILPDCEPIKEDSNCTLLDQLSKELKTERKPGPPTASHSYEDDRLQRILQLLDRYTQNLEEHIFTKGRAGQVQHVKCETDVQPVQQKDQGTQTSLCTLRLNETNNVRPKVNRHIAWNEQQCQPLRQQQQVRPQQQQQQQTEQTPAPCESRHHVITISSNGSPAVSRRPEPRTFGSTFARTVGDFAAACCLCFQVNKDCIFCLGFFIAFVISASFLTAFFYRTINLTTAVRVPVDPSAFTGASHSNEVATLRFNGGFYYVYNSQRRHFV